jgi:beta-fructofuranosidase
MSWGQLVSKDMLNWELQSKKPALSPDQPYDREGVFTGCWLPTLDNKAQKVLKVAYSSVQYLPFHWSTPPYPRNAAGLAIATSVDGGKTWVKSANNPILKGEPNGVDVTGFRDPAITTLGLSPDQSGNTPIYGLISGGIVSIGPTTFLYEITDGAAEEWKYINPLVDIPPRFQPSRKWSGNYGVNWECTNLITLRRGPEERSFLIIGVEGDVEKEHIREGSRHKAVNRTVRSQLWMSGHLETTHAGIKFKHEHGGFLDHGPYYAANTFHDVKSGRFIAYGWLPEEDLPTTLAHQKGWNGSLAVPRELFLLRIPNVVGALRSQLAEIYPFEVASEGDGLHTLLTLGVRPIAELDQLRESCQQYLKSKSLIALPSTNDGGYKPLFQPGSATWDLRASIAVGPGCETVGFHIRHSENLEARTSVYFSTIDEMIVVDRHASTTDRSINTCPDAGPFTLLWRKDDNSGEASLERMHIRILCDADILEVFVNERFALATMVYSTSDMTGISAFAVGDPGSARFETIELWDGIKVGK